MRKAYIKQHITRSADSYRYTGIADGGKASHIIKVRGDTPYMPKGYVAVEEPNRVIHTAYKVYLYADNLLIKIDNYI